MEDKITIVEKIRALANAQGYSLTTLEAKLELGNGTISRWNKSSPNSDKLTKVADFFHVSTDYLLGRESKIDPALNSMFNSVEFVRALCQERKIAVSKLEKDLGYGNGYFNAKKQAKIPYDRAVEIAEYLSVSPELILTGKETEKAPTDAGERKMSDAELKFALWGDCADVSDEDLADVRRYAAFVRERKKG